MLHNRMAAGLIGLSLVLVSSWSLVAHADTAPERALALHDEAKQLYARGKYNEAVAKLKLAVELDPEAKNLYYNLGLIEEKLGHIDTALAYFRRCLELEQSDEEKLRLAKTVKRLEGARSYVSWDDNEQTAPVIIRENKVDSPAGGGNSELLPWAYVTGATAVGATLIGVILASRASALDPGDTPVTTVGDTPQELQDDADAAHALAIGADVTFGIAAGALATTVVLALISAHGVGASEVAENHTVSVGPGGAHWMWRF